MVPDHRALKLSGTQAYKGANEWEYAHWGQAQSSSSSCAGVGEVAKEGFLGKVASTGSMKDKQELT